MTDIFVSKEIAQKLKKIGFEELCIAYYQDYEGFDNLYVSNIETDESISTLTDALFVCNHNFGDDEISAPTWEQVFKWFRDKGFSISMTEFLYTFSYKIGTLNFSKQVGKIEAESFPTYEECRDALILKLIELYQNNLNNGQN